MPLPSPQDQPTEGQQQGQGEGQLERRQRGQRHGQEPGQAACKPQAEQSHQRPTGQAGLAGPGLHGGEQEAGDDRQAEAERHLVAVPGRPAAERLQDQPAIQCRYPGGHGQQGEQRPAEKERTKAQTPERRDGQGLAALKHLHSNAPSLPCGAGAGPAAASHNRSSAGWAQNHRRMRRHLGTDAQPAVQAVSDHDADQQQGQPCQQQLGGYPQEGSSGQLRYSIMTASPWSWRAESLYA